MLFYSALFQARPLLPCFFILFPLFSFQGANEGVPSKLNNVSLMLFGISKKRSDLGGYTRLAVS